jgi:transcriptional regulator with XRE-family HTH domain
MVPEHVSRALAAEIADRRKATGMSQAQFAKHAGFRWTNTYQRLEYHERSINVIQLVAIANALETTADKLLRAAQARAKKGEYPESPGVAGAFGIS